LRLWQQTRRVVGLALIAFNATPVFLNADAAVAVCHTTNSQGEPDHTASPGSPTRPVLAWRGESPLRREQKQMCE